MEQKNTNKSVYEQAQSPSSKSDASQSTIPIQGINIQILKKATLTAYQKVSEALKECTVLNRQIDETMDGVDTSFQKLQRIDQELQGQLQIIRMLVVQLENKKLDVQLLFDKVLVASQCQQNLQTILAQLGKSQVNQSIIKQSQSDESHEEIKQSMSLKQSAIAADYGSPADLLNPPSKSMQESTERKSEIHKTGSFPQDLKIHTLADFVDEDSIGEISGKAELAFASLKSLKEKTIEITEGLIKKVETQISSIYKSKGDLDFQAQVIKDKYTKIKNLISEIHKMFVNVEKIYQKIDSEGLNISSQEHMMKIYQALQTISNQTKIYLDEIHITYDIFKTCSESYDEFYENSRESYVSFVNFAPSVQIQMQDVDKWHQQFDIRRQQCIEDFDEIEKLTTWYEYFQKSYSELEKELDRRKQYDYEMQQKVEMMRLFFKVEIEQEQSRRLDFNDQHYRYLPPNLKQFLEEPPTRYEIYPKHLILENIEQDQNSTILNPQQIMDFLQDWSVKNQQKVLSFSQQVQGSSEKMTSSNMEMLGGSVLQDDYFHQRGNPKEVHISGNLEEDIDNFISLENEDEFDHPYMKNEKVETTIGTNTSTKTSGEEKKTI